MREKGHRTIDNLGCSMDPRIQRQLSTLNWDFVDDDGGVAAGLHWYPGTFVPSVPAALIEALTQEGQVVFDPYCGVGTTGIAATIRSRNSVLTDLNPVALLSTSAAMALATLAIGDERKLLLGLDIVDHLVDLMAGRATLLRFGREPVAEVDNSITRYCDNLPDFSIGKRSSSLDDLSSLAPWFDAGTAHWLKRFLDVCVEHLGRGFLFLIAATMISSVVRSLSSQTQSWGHIADNVRPKLILAKDPESAMRRWLSRTRSRFLKVGRQSESRRPGRFTISQANWMVASALEVPSTYDLIVTSPPYAGAIDYALAQRLSLYLFGWDEQDIALLVNSEIGARRKRSKADHISSWANQVAQVASLHTQFARPGSHAAYVLPHKDSGRAMGEEAIVASMQNANWSVDLIVDRSIRQARARQSWTSIKKETILVFGGP
jgi:hypothetical protein